MITDENQVMEEKIEEMKMEEVWDEESRWEELNRKMDVMAHQINIMNKRSKKMEKFILQIRNFITKRDHAEIMLDGLPVEDEEGLVELEKRLEEPEIVKPLLKELKGVDLLSRSIIDRFLGKRLQLQFNFSGNSNRGSKSYRAFQETNIYNRLLIPASEHHKMNLKLLNQKLKKELEAAKKAENQRNYRKRVASKTPQGSSHSMKMEQEEQMQDVEESVVEGAESFEYIIVRSK